HEPVVGLLHLLDHVLRDRLKRRVLLLPVARQTHIPVAAFERPRRPQHLGPNRVLRLRDDLLRLLTLELRVDARALLAEAARILVLVELLVLARLDRIDRDRVLDRLTLDRKPLELHALRLAVPDAVLRL